MPAAVATDVRFVVTSARMLDIALKGARFTQSAFMLEVFMGEGMVPVEVGVYSSAELPLLLKVSSGTSRVRSPD